MKTRLRKASKKRQRLSYPRRHRTDPIWNYFTRLDVTSRRVSKNFRKTKRKTFICKTCSWSSLDYTRNATQHLQVHHKDAYEKFVEEKGQYELKLKDVRLQKQNEKLRKQYASKSSKMSSMRQTRSSRKAVQGDTDLKDRMAKFIKPARLGKEFIRTHRPAQLVQELSDIKLEALNKLGTLGVGGFGRVELVCIKGDKTRTFAVKTVAKQVILDEHQTKNIFAEKNIMLECNTDWIVKLFKTFRDEKYVYMLMEACLGGSLLDTLNKHGPCRDRNAKFNNSQINLNCFRFYAACVLEGLEYLHRNSIIYRDLKPENCLLTESGYLKLTDLGFAKKLDYGKKTWTECGTNDYQSPEIKNRKKGHDHTTDYWSLGIFICELKIGHSPYGVGANSLTSYKMMLKKLDERKIGKKAAAIARKLCVVKPMNRLGSGNGGINDIRNDPWLANFKWNALRSRTIQPDIIPKIRSPTDISNFEKYPEVEDELPPDELSGWDKAF